MPGGHLEFGESPEETAVREVREETGLNIECVRFGAVTNDIFIDDYKHYVTLWMISNWQSGEPQILEPDKFIEQKWVDFDRLPENLFLPWEQLKHSQFYENLVQELAKTDLKGEKR